MLSRNSLLRLYDAMPLGVRAHMRIRWATCPLMALEAVVPRAGRILEVGAGHGLFSAHLALSSSERDVTGTDIASDKVDVAQAVARTASLAGSSNLRFQLAAEHEFPRGPWDAIVLVDVLYLVSVLRENELFSGAAKNLAPGGLLVIKEMDVVPAWRFQLMRAQEVAAVRLLGLTEGATIRFVPPGERCARLKIAGFSPVEARDFRGRHLYPHHLIVATKPIETARL